MSKKARVYRGAFLAIGILLAGCDEEVTDESVELLRAEDAITVYVVQDSSAEESVWEGIEPPEPVVLTAVSSTDIVIATVDADPRVVPVSWGELSGDAATDYMMVTVSVESEFVESIRQVELLVAAGDGSSEGWCYPMFPDAAVAGRFYLMLQPACEERDPLTGLCDISSLSCKVGGAGTEEVPGCRQDVLTFSFWDVTSLACHDLSQDGE